MKRYLLFAYRQGEAQGGWFDFEGAYDIQEQAESRASFLEDKNKFLSWHIYDLKLFNMVSCKETIMDVRPINNKYVGAFNKSKAKQKG